MKRLSGILLLAAMGGICNAQTPALNPQQEQKARELLQRKIDEQEGRATPAPQPATRIPTLTEVEQAFIANKISARQFQLYLQLYKLQYAKPSSTTTEAEARLHSLVRQLDDPPAGQATATAAAPAPAPRPVGNTASASLTPPVTVAPTKPIIITKPAAPAPAIPVAQPTPATPAAKSPAPAAANVAAPATTSSTKATPASPSLPLSEPEDPDIAAAEAKLNELLLLKEARERALQIEAFKATNAPAGLKTKRQRLDDLLRLHVEGKLSDADYKARREAIITEPDK